MNDTGPLVYLDTETTGLEPGVHQVWEIAYAVEDGTATPRLIEHQLMHTLEHADPEALRISRHADRARPITRDQHDAAIAATRSALTGATIVGANPGFDLAHLALLLGDRPWSYRTVDVSTGVMWLLGLERPRGLLGSTYELRNRGHQIPMPDHTAGGDVRTACAVYRALRREFNGLPPVTETPTAPPSRRW